ncbi:MAG: MopE-related protein [Deltaproteobacteria bacterium]|nr:MopE-related protein [Deltaproteobacteria bacterium]
MRTPMIHFSRACRPAARALALVLSLGLCPVAHAQLSQGGLPPSWDLKLPLAGAKALPVRTLPRVDVAAYQAEDALQDGTARPWRFGAKLPVDLDPAQAGLWETLPGGDRLWRLVIRSPGALSLNLIFDDYRLPPGAELFIHAEDRSALIGAFTEANHRPDGVFATSLLPTEAIVLELREPKDAPFRSRLHLASVTHGYRDVFGLAKVLGESGSCNNNVACPEALGWENEIRSVVMLVSGGDGFCTGAMINNTSGDGTPYLLTANHCYSDPSSWVFWFNWQSPTCSNPGSSPPHDTLSGATLRARRVDSDFCLIELDTAPPASFTPYYAGWNRSSSPPSASVGIHHPSGDIKKISFDNDPAVAAAYGGGPNDHWEVQDWDDGTTEGGSSGSPLFGPDHRIVGQLHGGSAACGNNLEDLYGRFDVSWDGNSASERLRDWLDPAGTAPTGIDGLDPFTPTVPLDAQLTLTAPVGGTSTCVSSITPEVILRNRGTAALVSAQLVLQVDGVPVETRSWTGSLATHAAATVTFSSHVVGVGSHTVTVTLVAPNGGTDENPANDVATTSFTTLSAVGRSLPFGEDFEGGTFPPPGWQLENPDGSFTWEQSSAVGSAGSSASATVNNYDYNSSGQVDWLYGPYLDLARTGGPVTLSFDLAYARYNDTLWDGLGVEVSTDCGGSWSQVFFKESTALATAADLQAYYTPAPGEWRTETIDLSAYLGEPSVQLRFVNQNGYGNWLYLDSLNVTGASSPGDQDGDGFTVTAGDCDDGDPTVNPGASEGCNGVDDDCDGATDEGVTTDYWPDGDRDGYGDASVAPTAACAAPAGMVTDASDCDDGRASVHPGALELCNGGRDDDCDPTTTEGSAADYWPDTDGDGFGAAGAAPITACALPAGMSANDLDCNDANPSMHPGAAELCNLADEDCDGATDEGLPTTDFFLDGDGDGWGDAAGPTLAACQAPGGYAAEAGDCAPADPWIHPGATELCDGVDQDCDGATDEGATNDYWPDLDGDNYGDARAIPTAACSAPPGLVANGDDCRDDDREVRPGALEACNGRDDDCDGVTDESLPTAGYWPDLDGDGHGDPNGEPVRSCRQLPGTAPNFGDCRDDDATIHPRAPELCDGIDNDCDGNTDEELPLNRSWPDADGDGRGDASVLPLVSCAEPPAGRVENSDDCDDAEPDVYRGAGEQLCNGRDDDCDRTTLDDPEGTCFVPDGGTSDAGSVVVDGGGDIGTSRGCSCESEGSGEGSLLGLLLLGLLLPRLRRRG